MNSQERFLYFKEHGVNFDSILEMHLYEFMFTVAIIKAYKKVNGRSIIYDCPAYDDMDCQLNINGLCHDISTILSKVPSGISTCNAAVINFNRSDYLSPN